MATDVKLKKKYSISKNSKSKYHNSKTINDFYLTYSGKVSKEKYKKIISLFFEFLMNPEIIVNRRMYTNNLGSFRIIKISSLSNIESRPIDWNLSKKYNKKIYHLNLHSDGKSFKLKWFKKVNTPNVSIYTFQPLRKTNRYLSAHIKKLSKDPFQKSYDTLS